MTSFASLGITEPILTALTDYGYAEPTVIQEKAIPAGIAGRDVLGSAQTGTGKTCAFGVPILQRLAQGGRGRTIRALILTPTRELAIQIDENLHAYGKNLPLTEAVIFGGVGQAPQVDQLKRGVDILTATPGRLLDLAGQGLLDLSKVEIFVLDEADRMLDMGFIHDVRKVIRLLPQKKQTMFFSATLPPEILDLVDTLLHDPVKVAAAPVSSPVEVIRQEVCLVDRKNKTALLLEILEQEQVKSALVFTRTKHGADKVARDLTRRGVAAAAIHGNKSQTARQESLRKFKEGKLRVLVATDIAARGLDIEELSYVFNYNLSEVPETYIHRIGRTGRAGRGGTAISFCDYGEMPMLKDIEKLLKKPIPRRAHDYPMEVFEVPVKDAKGRVVNPEDAEARQAAREKHAAQRKQAAEKATEKAAQPPDAPADPAPGRKRRRGQGQGQTAAPQPPAQPPEKGEKTRRTFPHGRIWGIWRTSWPPSLWRRARCPFPTGTPWRGRSSWTPPPGSWRPNRCTNTISPARPTASGEKGTKSPRPRPSRPNPSPRKRRPRPPRRPRPERPPRRGRPPRRRRGLGRSADRLPAPAGAEGASRPGWSRPRAGRRTPLSRRV